MYPIFSTDKKNFNPQTGLLLFLVVVPCFPTASEQHAEKEEQHEEGEWAVVVDGDGKKTVP